MTTAPADEWIIREDRPVFEEHGDIDESRLRRIAENNNRRIEQSGDEVPLIVGHTRDGLPEHEQPQIVGYADNFTVRRGKGGKARLYCRFKFLPEVTIGRRRYKAADVMGSFPRVSPEFLPGDDILDPIALLGATTPALPLGLLRSQHAGPRIRYQQGAPMDPTATPPGTPMDLPTFLQALQALIAQASGAPAANPIADPGEIPPAVDRNQYSAAAAPSGTNTTLPDDDDEAKDKDKVRMATDQERIRFAKLEADQKVLREENRELRRKFACAEYEREFIQAEAEGYQFDRAEEMAVVAPEGGEPMPRPQFDAHMARIRKRYSRVPAGDFIRTARIAEGGGKRKATAEDAAAAVKIAQTERIPYEAALAKQLNGNAG